MKSFSDLTGREKSLELLRWILVLPAGVLGRFAAAFLGALVSWLAASGWGTSAESQFTYYLQLLMYYVPKEAAFVVAGAKMAPRRRFATAIVLGVAGILMSLMIHVLGQRNSGVTNYTHFILESTGAACGVAYICYAEKRVSIPADGGGQSCQ